MAGNFLIFLKKKLQKVKEIYPLLEVKVSEEMKNTFTTTISIFAVTCSVTGIIHPAAPQGADAAHVRTHANNQKSVLLEFQ